MNAKTLTAIVRTDILRLVRDQFLLGAGLFVVGLALGMRWVIPWLGEEIAARADFDVAPYVPMAVTYFVVVNASVISGLIAGFLLLETREEDTIRAMLVTPTPVSVPVATVAGITAISAMVLTVILSLAVGTGAPSFGVVALCAVLGSPMGVIFALLLSTQADNKIEAFAVAKITSVLGMVPIGAFFLPEPWQYLAGVVPIYWPCKIWWTAAEGGAWGWMVGPAVAVSALWITVLVFRFRSVVKSG